jgi:8-oxo-dGTP pyrophosphatase MutT (NUDIX family)
MSDKPAPAQPKPAATILLLRDVPRFQVLMVKRHHQVDFASNALVFPGGKTHAGDAELAWGEFTLGWNDFDAEQRSLRIGAIREAFEESGILLCKHRDGRAFNAACDPAVRAAVDAREVAFMDVVRDLNVVLDLSAMAVFARWITPTMMPKRFDTWFYAALAPAEQVAACDGRETVEAEWIAPGEALRLSQTGERTIIFPTRMNLRLLAEAGSAADCIERARKRRLVAVEPRLVERDGKPVLVIPADAGYGDVVEPLDAMMGEARKASPA